MKKAQQKVSLVRQLLFFWKREAGGKTDEEQEKENKQDEVKRSAPAVQERVAQYHVKCLQPIPRESQCPEVLDFIQRLPKLRQVEFARPSSIRLYTDILEQPIRGIPKENVVKRGQMKKHPVYKVMGNKLIEVRTPKVKLRKKPKPKKMESTTSEDHVKKVAETSKAQVAMPATDKTISRKWRRPSIAQNIKNVVPEHQSMKGEGKVTAPLMMKEVPLESFCEEIVKEDESGKLDHATQEADATISVIAHEEQNTELDRTVYNYTAEGRGDDEISSTITLSDAPSGLLGTLDTNDSTKANSGQREIVEMTAIRKYKDIQCTSLKNEIFWSKERKKKIIAMAKKLRSLNLKEGPQDTMCTSGHIGKTEEEQAACKFDASKDTLRKSNDVGKLKHQKSVLGQIQTNESDFEKTQMKPIRFQMTKDPLAESRTNEITIKHPVKVEKHGYQKKISHIPTTHGDQRSMKNETKEKLQTQRPISPFKKANSIARKTTESKYSAKDRYQRLPMSTAEENKQTKHLKKNVERRTGNKCQSDIRAQRPKLETKTMRPISRKWRTIVKEKFLVQKPKQESKPEKSMFKWRQEKIPAQKPVQGRPSCKNLPVKQRRPQYTKQQITTEDKLLPLKPNHERSLCKKWSIVVKDKLLGHKPKPESKTERPMCKKWKVIVKNKVLAQKPKPEIIVEEKFLTQKHRPEIKTERPMCTKWRMIVKDKLIAQKHRLERSMSKNWRITVEEKLLAQKHKPGIKTERQMCRKWRMIVKDKVLAEKPISGKALAEKPQIGRPMCKKWRAIVEDKLLGQKPKPEIKTESPMCTKWKVIVEDKLFVKKPKIEGKIEGPMCKKWRMIITDKLLAQTLKPEIEAERPMCKKWRIIVEDKLLAEKPKPARPICKRSKGIVEDKFLLKKPKVERPMCKKWRNIITDKLLAQRLKPEIEAERPMCKKWRKIITDKLLAQTLKPEIEAERPMCKKWRIIVEDKLLAEKPKPARPICKRSKVIVEDKFLAEKSTTGKPMCKKWRTIVKDKLLAQKPRPETKAARLMCKKWRMIVKDKLPAQKPIAGRPICKKWTMLAEDKLLAKKPKRWRPMCKKWRSIVEQKLLAQKPMVERKTERPMCKKWRIIITDKVLSQMPKPDIKTKRPVCKKWRMIVKDKLLAEKPRSMESMYKKQKIIIQDKLLAEMPKPGMLMCKKWRTIVEDKFLAQKHNPEIKAERPMCKKWRMIVKNKLLAKKSKPGSPSCKKWRMVVEHQLHSEKPKPEMKRESPMCKKWRLIIEDKLLGQKPKPEIRTEKQVCTKWRMIAKLHGEMPRQETKIGQPMCKKWKAIVEDKLLHHNAKPETSVSSLTARRQEGRKDSEVLVDEENQERTVKTPTDNKLMAADLDSPSERRLSRKIRLSIICRKNSNKISPE